MDCPPTSSRTRRRCDKSARPSSRSRTTSVRRHNGKPRHGCQCAKRPMLGPLAALAADMRVMVLRGARRPFDRSDGRTMKRLLAATIGACAAAGLVHRRGRIRRKLGRARLSTRLPSRFRRRRRGRPIGSARSHRSAAASCSRPSSPPSTAPGGRWRRRRSSRPSARTASIRPSAAPAVRTRIPVSAATTIRSSAARATTRPMSSCPRGSRAPSSIRSTHRSRASVTPSRSWARASSSCWRVK